MGKRDREPSTPTLRFHREPKYHKESKSAPQDFFKTHKKKKTHHEVSGVTTPRKSKHRGGWTMEDSGDFYDNSRNKSWRYSPTGSSQGDRRSKHTRGWTMEDPGNFFENNGKKSFRSPATPSSHGHRISALTAGGHLSISQSSKRTRKFSGNPNFRGSSGVW